MVQDVGSRLDVVVILMSVTQMDRIVGTDMWNRHIVAVETNVVNGDLRLW